MCNRVHVEIEMWFYVGGAALCTSFRFFSVPHSDRKEVFRILTNPGILKPLRGWSSVPSAVRIIPSCAYEIFLSRIWVFSQFEGVRHEFLENFQNFVFLGAFFLHFHTSKTRPRTHISNKLFTIFPTQNSNQVFGKSVFSFKRYTSSQVLVCLLSKTLISSIIFYSSHFSTHFDMDFFTNTDF